MYPGKCNFFILLALLSAFDVSAQQFEWKAGYFGFLDNREYDNIYAYDQTMFGSRISGEFGTLIDDRNKVSAGIDYLYEFGSKGDLIAPDIILYFSGSKSKFSYSMGAFPRFDRLSVPLALLTDTLNYYRPNIEGIYLEYKTTGFRHNLWIDWTGRRSETTRESFTLGLSGYLDKGMLIYRHHFVLNHLAHTEPNTPGDHLRDNFGYSVMAGVNLTSVTGLDSLTLITGILGSGDRIRSFYDFRFPTGWMSEIDVRYKRFGLHGILYYGDEQDITSGDRSYTSDFYTRADAYYQITNRLIDSRLQFSFHHLTLANEFSAQFIIRINIGNEFSRKRAE